MTVLMKKRRRGIEPSSSERCRRRGEDKDEERTMRTRKTRRRKR